MSNVDHPKHYTSLGAKCAKCAHPIECIDVTRHMPFNVGNAVKYLWRHGLKNGVEDLKKAAWYVADAIAHAEGTPPRRTEPEEPWRTEPEEPWRTDVSSRVENSTKLAEPEEPCIEGYSYVACLGPQVCNKNQSDLCCVKCGDAMRRRLFISALGYSESTACILERETREKCKDVSEKECKEILLSVLFPRSTTAISQRVQELLENNTKLVEDRRAVDRRAMLVHAHREVFDQPVRTTPTIPSDDEVRLRARLMAEEFVETLKAMFVENGYFPKIEKCLKDMIDHAVVKVDLVELADGLADLKVILEGADLVFGIPSNEVFAEVHRSNMAKTGGPRREDGKRLKPEGWTPPDIAGLLRKSGWTG